MGQRRLSLVWDRLVLPDGRTALLPEMPSQDGIGAAGTQIALASGEMVRRSMDLRPTLSLPQGTATHMLLTGDLTLEPYR